MSNETRYLTVVETAKLVRLELAKHFPKQKFSVGSESYSGGASIDIFWTDGVRAKEVEPIAKRFKGADFDGMIDMAIHNKSWLLPDGSAELASSPGTEGSLGTIPRFVSKAPHPNAELVRFGADHVFCNRSISNFEAKEVEALALIRKRCRCEGNPPNDRFGNDWVTNLARQMVWDKGEDESMTAAFERVVLNH